MPRKIKQVVHPPKLERKKRVAAYARVSSGKDAMLHSLSAQVRYYSDLIQHHADWSYCGVFSDEALTGTKDTREQFLRLLAECRAGKVDMVITKSISRFARNTVTLLEVVRELKTLGVDVFFEEQNIHTVSADGELMLTILASYAQEESLSASENQKWRIRRAFEQGELMNWRFLYGYRINSGVVGIEPKEAEIVQEIFRRAIEGDSLGTICRDLQRRDVRSTFGGTWTVTSIRRILSNEKYCGDALLQKQYRNNHLEKKLLLNRGELPKYYAEGTHPPIVEREVFEQAQALLARLDVKAAVNKPRTTNVFTGLIRCPRCGTNYKRVTSNGSIGWNCATYQRYGKQRCFGKKIPDDTLRHVTTDALCLPAFDEHRISELLEHITVTAPNELAFHLKDGSIVERIWKDRSRSESWTHEMKQSAAARTKQQRRKANGTGSTISADDPADD